MIQLNVYKCVFIELLENIYNTFSHGTLHKILTLTTYMYKTFKKAFPVDNIQN